MHLKLDFYSTHNVGTATGSVVYKGVTCGSLGTCNPYVLPAGSRQSGYKDYNFSTCVDVNPANFGRKDVSVSRIAYESTGSGMYRLGANIRWKAGSCSQPVTGHTYMSGGWGFTNGGGPEAGPDPGVDPAPSSNTGPNGPNSGPTINNTGNGTKGTGAGGGGGDSSSANKQKNDPNSIPSSTSQGDGTQPDVIPNPFFDGKEYASGSDTDTLGSTISSTGKKLIKSWYYVLAAVTLGGVGGAVYWRWRQKHKV